MTLYTPPPHYTLYICAIFVCIPYTYSHREGGGELTREKVRGATVHKAVAKFIDPERELKPALKGQ
jgi:hypothetical protein